jgi:HK97 family phage major capsid protein
MSIEVKSAVDALAKVVTDERSAREVFEKRSDSERKEFEAKADAEFAKVQKSLEEVNVKLGRITIAGAGDAPKNDEHKSAFVNYIRNPRDQKSIAALQDAERKAVYTTGTGGSAAGGYAVPEELSRAIITQLTNISPMRQVANVVTASSPDYKILVDTLGTGTAWAGENATRSESNTPQLGEVAPTFGTLYAYPKASEESLNDMFFDVGAWLTNSVSVAFAAAEGVAFTTGNGTNKPTGLMAATKSSSDDASLAFGSVQYVPTGAAAGFPALSLTSPVAYPADKLVDLVHKLKAGYRANARWMMNKATLAVVRKFKDSDANYLWQPGLAAGMPSSLLGYAVVENEDMADIGANAFPIAFGDFRAAYTIVDLVGLRVTLDEVTTPGQVKWIFRKRIGGKLADNQAVKVIKCATT